MGVDADVDFLRPLLYRIGTCLRQRDLQLGEALIRGGHHEKDQDDQQHVDHRNEIDLRLIAEAAAAQVHRSCPSLPPLAAVVLLE